MSVSEIWRAIVIAVNDDNVATKVLMRAKDVHRSRMDISFERCLQDAYLRMLMKRAEAACVNPQALH